MEYKTRDVKKFWQTYKIPLILFFGVLGVKLFLNLFIQSMALATGDDDIGTIASAAYFAGLDWSGVISQTLYYGWGYSMLMAPAFMLTENVYIIIQIMLGYNAVLLAGSVVIAYSILHKIWKIEEKGFCAAVALASNCFFFALINTNIIYNETAIIFLIWVIFYIVLKIQLGMQEKKPVWGWTLGLVFFLAYGMTVHTRFIFVWGAVAVLIIVCLMLQKKFLGNILIFVVGLPIGYLISSKLNAWMQDVLWKVNERDGELTNTMENAAGKIDNILDLGTPEGVEGFLEACLGQGTIMYLLTGGILAAFIILVVKAVRKVFQTTFSKKEKTAFVYEEETLDQLLLTSIIFIGALLIASMLFTVIAALPSLIRAVDRDWVSKWFVYSRYWGVACPMAMLLVFVWMKKCKDGAAKKKLWIGTVVLLVVTMILFAIFVAPRLISGKISGALVFQVLLGPTFSHFDARFSVGSFVALFLFGGIWFIILTLLCRKNRLVSAALVTMVCGIYIFGYKMVAADIPLAEACYNRFLPIQNILEQCEITPEQEPMIYIDDGVKGFCDAQLTLNRYRLIAREYKDYSVCNTEDKNEYQNIGILITNKIGVEMSGYWSIIHQENGVNREGEEEVAYYVLVRTGELSQSIEKMGIKVQDISEIYNVKKFISETNVKGLRVKRMYRIGKGDVLQQDFNITSSMKKEPYFAIGFMFKNAMVTPPDGKVKITISQKEVKRDYFVTMDNIVTEEKFYLIVDRKGFTKGDATITFTCEDAEQFQYILPYILPLDEETVSPDEKHYPLKLNGKEENAEVYTQIFIPKSLDELNNMHIAPALHTEILSKDAVTTLSPLENGQVFSQRFRIAKSMLKQEYFGMEFLVRNYNSGSGNGKFVVTLIQDEKTKSFEFDASELREKDYLRVVMKSQEISAGITTVEITYTGEKGNGYPKFYSLKPTNAEIPNWILGRLCRDGKKAKHCLYMNLFSSNSGVTMEKYRG